VITQNVDQPDQTENKLNLKCLVWIFNFITPNGFSNIDKINKDKSWTESDHTHLSGERTVGRGEDAYWKNKQNIQKLITRWGDKYIITGIYI